MARNIRTELSKIRAQMVLLQTDTERVAPELESFHRNAIEDLILKMESCDLSAVLTGYSEFKAAGEMLAHRAKKSDIDVTQRIDDIDTLLRETLLELATEKCHCQLPKPKEGGKTMERMPRINPHDTSIKQDQQLRDQIKWLKDNNFETPGEAQQAGY